MTDAEASSGETRPSLLLRVRDPRDDDAWAAFVDLYAPLIYRHCRRRGLQDSDAADVAQEVMVQVARSMRDFEYRPARGRFRDWLRAVVHSRIENHLRAGRRVPRPLDAADLEAASAGSADESGPAWEAEFHAQLLRTALGRVRPRFEPATWRAFELSWLESRPAGEVASTLEVPIDSVYVARSRVLKRLRAEVEDLNRDSPLA